MTVRPGRQMAHRAGRYDRLEQIASRPARDAGAARLAVASRVLGRLGLPAGRSRWLAIAAMALVALGAVPALTGSGDHAASALNALARPSAASSVPAAPTVASSARLVSAAGATAATGQAAPPAASAPTLESLGGVAGLNPIDLGAKALFVLGLLYLTLMALRRLQGGQATGSSCLGVLETRPLGPKASIHLVAVGDRRLVVGLTPGGMVALAELDASELPAAARSATSSATSIPSPASAARSVFATATSVAANRLATAVRATRRATRLPEDLL
jgi:flagellar biosynthetic protein FliO